MIEITQHQAAKLPFHSRYPTAKLIAFIMSKAGLLKPLAPIHIIDLTFGEGIFYHAIKHKAVIVAVDIRKLNWVVKPRCFLRKLAQEWREWLPTALECLNNRIDLIVIDPPWQEKQRGRGLAGVEREHYYVSRAAGHPRDILLAGVDAARYLQKPLLYHYKEPLNYNHIVGPIAYKPFFYVFNKKAENYRSYFGVVEP